MRILEGTREVSKVRKEISKEKLLNVGPRNLVLIIHMKKYE